METARFTRIFEPIKIGRVTAKNRIVAPPHPAMLGNLFGTEAEAARYTNYWRSLAEGGTGWLVAQGAQHEPGARSKRINVRPHP